MNISQFKRDRLPFFTALDFGLLAYGFCMLNKIPVGDDLVGLFSKGATTVSGRYGLELTRLFLPDVSMPWIYGLMSLVLLALAVCVTVRLFRIRNRALQLLLAGVFVSFPAETGTLCYMFTAVPYALALLLTVLGVSLFAENRRGKWLSAPLLIAFSSNDALSASAENIGKLLNRKSVFFVPFRQDDAEKKPRSAQADFTLLLPAAEAALKGEQLARLVG